MIIKSQFKVDLFQLKHSRDPVGLIRAVNEQAARDLGVKLAEMFPFIKYDELSFKGELPHLSLNPQHEFNDLYKQELVVLTMGQWELLRKLVKDYAEEYFDVAGLIKEVEE